MKYNRFILIKWLVTLIVLVLIGTLTAAAYSAGSIKLVVNGREVKPDVSPQLIKGRTMVPVRWVAEALGARVDWNAEENKVLDRSVDAASSVDELKAELWITPLPSAFGEH